MSVPCEPICLFLQSKFFEMNKQLYKRILWIYGIGMLMLSVLRLVFLGVHHVPEMAVGEVLRSLGLGLIVDSSVMSCFMLGSYLLGLLGSCLGEKTGKIVLSVGLTLSLLVVSVVNASDIVYYGVYGTRLSYNVLALFFENTATNFKMLWEDYPLPWFVLGAVALVAVLYWMVNRIFRKVEMKPKRGFTTLAIVLTFSVLSFLYLSQPFWRITTFSTTTMLNHAASNGVYTLAKSSSIFGKTHRDMYSYNEEEVLANMEQHVSALCSDEETRIESMAPTLRKIAAPDTLAVPKNVVIVISESFSATPSGVLGQMERSYSPCFDTLCKEGVLFTNCYSCGPRTQHGIVSVLAGFPSVLGSSLIRRRDVNAFFTIADALDDMGYETNFIHGGDVDYDDMSDFLRLGGFHHIYGIDEFTEWRFKNMWGVCDDDMFDFAFEKIKSEQKPHLSVLLTMSNHEPYDIPEFFAEAHPEVLDMEGPKASYYYADFAFAAFVEKMKTLPDYENTLIVRIADHGEVYSEEDRGFRLFHIPALMLNSKEGCGRFDKVCSQIDFLPTILAEIGFQGAYPCMGQNMFSPDFKPFAIMNNYDNQRIWIHDGNIVSWNQATDMAKRYQMSESYLLWETKQPCDDEKQALKSYLSFLSYIFHKGLYYAPKN